MCGCGGIGRRSRLMLLGAHGKIHGVELLKFGEGYFFANPEPNLWLKKVKGRCRDWTGSI
ncbi:hypothetical protein lam_988 [Candidatus Liberibacter americanus str. Sao Paulo]|uniref:Uncharacterized protein n=1 Tax=Candidatus Liberibacter americanus str. Sao Paulo TaxID=1261131 RepID=U6B8Y1_9HYPH|nr:hypothetical protein lam_988 [Candidatus Liberibacter americanus str. Sao Paulo]